MRHAEFFSSFGAGDNADILSKLDLTYPRKDGSYYIAVYNDITFNRHCVHRLKDEFTDWRFHQHGHSYVYGFSEPGLPPGGAEDAFNLAVDTASEGSTAEQVSVATTRG